METLLLVARYEAGEASTLREPVDLGRLAVQVVEELQPVGEVKDVAITTDFPPQALRMLGDPHEIRRAIGNLVANALASNALRRSRRRARNVLGRFDRDFR